MHAPSAPRNLVLVLGDQLDPAGAAFDGFDPARDAVWMAEVAAESTRVWSAKPRIALFLAAMRHFRDDARARGLTVHYRELDDPANHGSLRGELAAFLRAAPPVRVIVAEPGEHDVAVELAAACAGAGVPLETRVDRHFFCTRERFARHAAGRKTLRMEYFYREMRREAGVLLDATGGPEGGSWNFDAENRGTFPATGPGPLPAPLAFPPDAVTRGVIDLVNRRFAAHPGSLDAFDWPVTPAQARAALDDFIAHRLPRFGAFQDAMLSGEPWLFHARISAALNLRLLDPRAAVAAAERAYREGRAPLAAAEGFIRQILGWREYVRGVYFLHMPGYRGRNALGAAGPLPGWYWTGDTPMRCLREVIGQTLRLGYAHHIQRLMVTGLYGLLLGVNPREMHEWYLAVYVDAVEWVELPNTLGMSQYADGGVMASKPYVATGAYIQRMSNHCAGCRFDPAEATGPRACPFTTLYWDFLRRHRDRFAAHPRLALQVRNLDRLPASRLAAIQTAADHLRQNHGLPPAAPAASTLPGF